MIHSLKEILLSKKSFAFLIGNGINRYSGDESISWEQMLLTLWKKHVPSDESSFVPDGISLIEFYDALDLTGDSKRKRLQNEFSKSLSNWKAGAQHEKIVNWAKSNSVPILTTNFDETLSSVLKLNIKHT